MTETNRIEYKRELTPELDIEKEIIAFLNYKEGGYIYIGIDKDGSTVGVKDVDDCMLKLKDRIKNNISPSAMVHIPADTRSAFPVISVQSPVSIQCCWQS